MTTLKNGEHTNYTSKNGTAYWVMNLNGRYYVNRKNSVYGMKKLSMIYNRFLMAIIWLFIAIPVASAVTV